MKIIWITLKITHFLRKNDIFSCHLYSDYPKEKKSSVRHGER